MLVISCRGRLRWALAGLPAVGRCAPFGCMKGEVYEALFWLQRQATFSGVAFIHRKQACCVPGAPFRDS